MCEWDRNKIFFFYKIVGKIIYSTDTETIKNNEPQFLVESKKWFYVAE